MSTRGGFVQCGGLGTCSNPEFAAGCSRTGTSFGPEAGSYPPAGPIGLELGVGMLVVAATPGIELLLGCSASGIGAPGIAAPASPSAPE